MSCRLFGAKPLPEVMMTHPVNLRIFTSSNFSELIRKHQYHITDKTLVSTAITKQNHMVKLINNHYDYSYFQTNHLFDNL